MMFDESNEFKLCKKISRILYKPLKRHDYIVRVFVWVSIDDNHFFFAKHLDARREETKKDDVLEGLVTGVNEPWIKNFLTKTLEMAVNGDKGVLTSEQDGREAVAGD